MGDGSSKSVAVTREAVNCYENLRDAMYTPEGGAWLASKVQVSGKGSYEFNFNYNDEPSWDLRPLLEMLIEDLEEYPRPVELIPLWHPGHPSNLG